jgi:TonB family protein
MKEKLKIMKTRPRLTDEEIKSFMNFDALLKQKARVQGTRNILTGLAGLTAIALLVFLTVLINNKSADRKSDIPISVSKPTPLTSVDSTEITSAPTRETPGAGRPMQGPKVIKKNTAGRSDTATRPAAIEKKEAIEYVQAEPVNGYPALYAYFNKNLVYPSAAVKDSIAGTVNVVFWIDPAGTARDIKIENSLGILFDSETIRLIQNMPLWKPAMYNGKLVRAKISVPITFEVKKVPNHP